MMKQKLKIQHEWLLILPPHCT